MSALLESSPIWGYVLKAFTSLMSLANLLQTISNAHLGVLEVFIKMLRGKHLRKVTRNIF